MSSRSLAAVRSRVRAVTMPGSTGPGSPLRRKLPSASRSDTTFTSRSVRSAAGAADAGGAARSTMPTPSSLATRPLPASRRCRASRRLMVPLSAGARLPATRSAFTEMATPAWRASVFSAWPRGCGFRLKACERESAAADAGPCAALWAWACEACSATNAAAQASTEARQP